MGFVDFGAFAIQVVNLLVILYVLNRFLFRPYLAYLDRETADREALRANVLDAEKVVRDARAESETILREAREESGRIRRESEEIAKRERADTVAKAKAEADAVRAKADADLRSDRARMEEELKKESVRIALDVNRKLFAHSDAHADFVRKECQTA